MENCNKRKPNIKFVCAVEGNTEALYIKWLADVINKMQEADYRCSIPEPKLGLNLSKARRNISTGDYYFAIADRETYNDENKFKMLIEKLKPSEGERDITFEFGYSNISFELWLLLHKMDFAVRGQFSLGIRCLVGAPCSGGWLHIHGHVDNTNWTGRVMKKKKKQEEEEKG